LAYSQAVEQIRSNSTRRSFFYTAGDNTADAAHHWGRNPRDPWVPSFPSPCSSNGCRWCGSPQRALHPMDSVVFPFCRTQKEVRPGQCLYILMSNKPCLGNPIAKNYNEQIKLEFLRHLDLP